MSLNEIVNVVISRQTSGITRAGFGTIAIIGPNATFAGRLQYYTGDDLASLAADLTNGVADPEYLAATNIFSQSTKVTRIAIGRIDVLDTDIAESLNAIQAEQSDWYGLTITSRVVADQEKAADWAEANEKIAGFGSADANIIDEADGVDVTTIAYYLKNNSLERSFAAYDSAAAVDWIEAAALGKVLPFDPGTYTLKFKTLASIGANALTPTQSGNATDKYANVYEEIGSKNIFREGTVGANEFIDIIIFIDWLKARIQESVYGLMTRLPKIPYTQSGIDSVGLALKTPLQTGQNRGGISPTVFDEDGNQVGGYIISLPSIQDVPIANKAARFLDNVKFTAYLAGAIHEVKINGVVTL